MEEGGWWLRGRVENLKVFFCPKDHCYKTVTSTRRTPHRPRDLHKGTAEPRSSLPWGKTAEQWWPMDWPKFPLYFAGAWSVSLHLERWRVVGWLTSYSKVQNARIFITNYTVLYFTYCCWLDEEGLINGRFILVVWRKKRL